jgi:hypothetical protein
MRVSLLALLVLASAAPQAPGVAEAVSEYVALFAGPGAIDCGQVPASATDAALQQLVDCGVAAAKRHQPFRAAQRSWNMTGLIGTAKGVAYAFEMRAACATDGSCPPMLSLEPCPIPEVDRGVMICPWPANGPAPAQNPREYLDAVMGTGSTDCGRLGIRANDADLRRGLDCALESSRRKRSFSLVKQDAGIDSSVYQGLVGNRAGTIFLFTFDSLGEKFSLGKCPAPTTFVSDKSPMRFACSQ